MIIKGLPVEFKPFCTAINQREKTVSFTDFNVALRNYEETNKSQSDNFEEDRVLRVNSAHRSSRDRVRPGNSQSLVCFRCNKPGHIAANCKENSRRENSRWCVNCKCRTHDTKYCRKTRDKVKLADSDTVNDGDNFYFRITVDSASSVHNVNSLLVDCGATSHIINDESKFVSFDKSFNADDHFIELADGSRMKNVALKRGDPRVQLTDSMGRICNVVLRNVLYIPTFKQNIFSVQAAIENGAHLQFKSNSGSLSASNGTVFNFTRRGRLYYMYACNTISSDQNEHSLLVWHRILGHCNVQDILKLQTAVTGMKISGSGKDVTCKDCILGKMTQNRSREPDERAKAPFQIGPL
ncbi:uncharacterized protein LOC141904358 [Tubulanus polymorphus]|uniref:uncharacterized protein LOC141904358 n=1 Tax=Tubulanus polymorphus TaxID=672921 RepID=UPI003DA257A4